MGNSNFDATDLFNLYDSTMEHLLEKYSPRRKIVMWKVPDCQGLMESVLPQRNWLIYLNVTSKIHLLKRGNTPGKPRSNYNAGYCNKNAAIIFKTTSRALQEMVEHFGSVSTHSSLRLKTPLHESPQINTSIILKIKLTRFENLWKTPQYRTSQLYHLLLLVMQVRWSNNSRSWKTL